MTFQELVQDRLDHMGLKPIAAANKYGLPRDSIRYVVEGRKPSIDRAEEICKALGLEFRIGLPDQGEAPAPPARSLIPVIGLAACGNDGWAHIANSEMRAPMPDRNMGKNSFAVIASGDSMNPYGIFAGQICYCDPDIALHIGCTALLERKRNDGTTCLTIKRLGVIGSGGDLEIMGFRPTIERASGTEIQESFWEIVPKSEIIRTAVVCWINTNPIL